MTPENLAKLKEQYWPLAPSLMLELIEDYEQLKVGIQDLAKTNYELGCKIEDDYKPYIKRLQTEIEQLQIELDELKPQALLLRQFLNNAHANIEQLSAENRRLKVANGKLEDEI